MIHTMWRRDRMWGLRGDSASESSGRIKTIMKWGLGHWGWGDS